MEQNESVVHRWWVMGTILSDPFMEGCGKGASIVKVPSFDRLLLTASGFTPFGKEKVWEKLRGKS